MAGARTAPAEVADGAPPAEPLETSETSAQQAKAWDFLAASRAFSKRKAEEVFKCPLTKCKFTGSTQLEVDEHVLLEHPRSSFSKEAKKRCDEAAAAKSSVVPASNSGVSASTDVAAPGAAAAGSFKCPGRACKYTAADQQTLDRHIVIAHPRARCAADAKQRLGKVSKTGNSDHGAGSHYTVADGKSAPVAVASPVRKSKAGTRHELDAAPRHAMETEEPASEAQGGAEVVIIDEDTEAFIRDNGLSASVAAQLREENASVLRGDAVPSADGADVHHAVDAGSSEGDNASAQDPANDQPQPQAVYCSPQPPVQEEDLQNEDEEMLTQAADTCAVTEHLKTQEAHMRTTFQGEQGPAIGLHDGAVQAPVMVSGETLADDESEDLSDSDLIAACQAMEESVASKPAGPISTDVAPATMPSNGNFAPTGAFPHGQRGAAPAPLDQEIEDMLAAEEEIELARAVEYEEYVQAGADVEAAPAPPVTSSSGAHGIGGDVRSNVGFTASLAGGGAGEVRPNLGFNAALAGGGAGDVRPHLGFTVAPVGGEASSAFADASEPDCFKCGNKGHWAKECPCRCGYRCRWKGGVCQTAETFIDDGFMGSASTVRGTVASTPSAPYPADMGSAASPAGGASSFGAAGLGECLKCGNPGHWARECPCRCGFRCKWRGGVCQNAADASGSRDAGINSGSRDAGIKADDPAVCFKCGIPGHWVRDCPCTCGFRCKWKGSGCQGSGGALPSGVGMSQQKESTAPRGLGLGGGAGCFKCGQEGHWARDCPGGAGLRRPLN